MRHSLRPIAMLTLAFLAVVAAPSTPRAQPPIVGPGLGGGALGGIGRIAADADDVLSRTTSAADPASLVTAREDRLGALVRAHPRALDRDDHGALVARGQVLLVGPTPASLEIARRAGFTPIAPGGPDADSAGVVALAVPSGLSTRAAVRRLRGLDPSGAYDFNHIYLPAGPPAEASVPRAGSSSPSDSVFGAGGPLGMIDTGVDVRGAAFAGAHVEQAAFAGGRVAPGAHGTAVASLLVGRAGPFRGAAPGAPLLVADVYGGDPAGGSAVALARALFWLDGRHARVVNISLVGPPNAALAAAVRTVSARGLLIVAPVGNDGPAAPEAYPASYPKVIAVTGVDARGRVLIEAGRSTHLDFAAPGADMAAAAPVGGFVTVRGTSYASPLVAGMLAALARGSGADAADAAVTKLAARATPGRGYGRGLVAIDLRTAPGAVHAAPGR